MHAPTRAGAPYRSDEGGLARPGAEAPPAEPQQPPPSQPQPGPAGARPAGRGPLTFTRLKWTSFTHSCVYTALLVSAFVAGKPEPLTFTLGLTHGLLWIFMSLACLTAARLRIVSVRLALAVGVLGGIGPFFGSYEFIREQRLRAAAEAGERRRPGEPAGTAPR